MPNAHEGYVSWEKAETIRKMVSSNVPTSRHHGAPKHGDALLAGLPVLSRGPAETRLARLVREPVSNHRDQYRTPSLDAVRTWRDQTPRDFLFAWKASK